MEHVDLFGSTHQDISHSWNHIYTHMPVNTIFQNDISFAAVDPTEKNRLHLIQFFHIVQAFFYLKYFFHFEFFLHVILADQFLHSFTDIVNDHGLLRRKRMEIPEMCQCTPYKRDYNLTGDCQQSRYHTRKSLNKKYDHQIGDSICDQHRQHLTVDHFGYTIY